VMARIERRSFVDYALPGREAFGARFWQGVAWGFVALTVLLLLIRADHGFSFGSMALHGRPLAHYAFIWGLAFLLVGFFEEFLMRGYALFTLTTGMGFWPSALLLSAVFGAAHLGNAGESWVGGAAAGLIGLFFCFTVRRTGSLWFAIGLHAMWDYSESFIYSVPDSGAMVTGHLMNSSVHGPVWLTGGTVGPEASWLVFAVIAAMFIVFDRLHRDVRFPLPSPQA
jgi:CAAX protease family protein